MNKKLRWLAWFIAITATVQAAAKTPKTLRQPTGLKIDRVVSAFPVGFDLLTAGRRQFVAYYDSCHQMTVAARGLDSDRWEYRKLDQKVPWDSHNSITMTTDRDGYLHLSGNMHGVPLVYYRSEKPYDIASLNRIDAMTGEDEKHVTYPAFMRDKQGRLIFHYRSGGSGDGYEIYNLYDPDTRTWRRLLDKPLIDGHGEETRNAYMQGPVLGADGWFHLIWVWRDTGDCATNHTLSYARSRDLLHWESIRGEAVPLPITFGDTVLYVDPTPPGGGLFNPGIKLGFDCDRRPVIGYHKYDGNGNNQLFVARFEDGAWKRVQLTRWNYRWHIQGWGSMPTELEISIPTVTEDGKIAFGYEHVREGKGQVLIDGKSLQPVGIREAPDQVPAQLRAVASSFPGMRVHTLLRGDYLLRWETLPTNNDRKPAAVPPPSELVLYKIR